MKLLSVDLGDVRCGIAVCDPNQTLATPEKTLQVRGLKDAAEQIAALAEQLAVGKIVVGMPLLQSGERGKRALRTEAFCAMLQEKLSIPVVTWDERFTTVEAYSLLRDTGKDQRKGKKDVDSLSAVLILQSYLDSKPRE